MAVHIEAFEFQWSYFRAGGFFAHKTKILPSYFSKEGLQFRKKATGIFSAFVSVLFC